MKSTILTLLTLGLGGALAALLGSTWPGGAAAVGAGAGVLLLRGGARDGLAVTLAAAACAALAAAGLRWAVLVTLSPAYPAEVARLAGPGVSAAVAGLCVAWAIGDRRRRA